ncbi:MAG: hypothetical protein ABIC04_03430 [Nanoarchaeota archaeon]
MGQRIEKIAEVFFENPGSRFTVRRLEKLSKISKSTVKNYLDLLKKVRDFRFNNSRLT